MQVNLLWLRNTLNRYRLTAILPFDMSIYDIGIQYRFNWRFKVINIGLIIL